SGEAVPGAAPPELVERSWCDEWGQRVGADERGPGSHCESERGTGGVRGCEHAWRAIQGRLASLDGFAPDDHHESARGRWKCDCQRGSDGRKEFDRWAG